MRKKTVEAIRMRREEQGVKDQFAQFMEDWRTAYHTLPLALKHAIAVGDVSGLSPLQQEIVKTATHEAGHAIYDAPFVDYVSIEPILACNKRISAGGGQYVLPISAGRSKSLRFVGEQMNTLPIELIGENIFAGVAAENTLVGGLGQDTLEAGSSGDMENFRRVCQARGVSHDEGRNLVYQSAVNAEKFVKKNTRRIWTLSTALINYKTVSGDDVRAIVANTPEDILVNAA